MNVTEYLERYEKADKKAKRLQKEYERENELIDAVRSPSDIDGLPRSGNIVKVTEIKAEKLSERATKLKIAQLEALHERQEIAETIFKVKDPDEMDVLIERYINYGQKWEEICVELHMSWGTVHNKHKRAKASVAEILEAQNLV